MSSFSFSYVLVAASPLLVGMGSAWLLTPRRFVQCGRRPTIQPPGWVFSVAWTALYLLAGVAAASAWRRANRRWTRGLAALAASILVLAAWWVVFANWCAPAAAFTAIVPATGLVVAASALLFADGDRVASALLLPLVAWMVFASTLSFLSIEKKTG